MAEAGEAVKVDASIPMPRRMSVLPRHKGLPVPAMVQFDRNGVPDFKVIDMEKWVTLARHRGCGMCGTAMGARMWFIGGPLSMEKRTFTDLPMHEDCAKYALQVCPFLALPRYRYAMAHVQMDGVMVNVNEQVSMKRPERFGLGVTPSYQVGVIEGSRSLVLVAAPFSSIEWWQQGRRIAG